ncbi:Uncharacterized protein TCM_011997 [Theobroma cacao]|uniref:Uncharacterized protein n=1 Tax=Theobroma cacao TaxID=3641 RepID=A0A061FUT0_THECC|nr:Uncharacterized protein TCM_011997 [Theobroma cacao]
MSRHNKTCYTNFLVDVYYRISALFRIWHPLWSGDIKYSKAERTMEQDEMNFRVNTNRSKLSVLPSGNTVHFTKFYFHQSINSSAFISSFASTFSSEQTL